jgi:hypothetical protein
MMRDLAKLLFEFFGRTLDLFPVNFKWAVAKLLPGRLPDALMKYGRARIFLWKIGEDSIFKIRSDSNDDYFEMSYKKEYASYEPETIEAWEELTAEKELVLDIGAYTGLFTLIASRKNGSKRCISIEPNPISFKKLENNMRLNHRAESVSALNIGAGLSISTAQLKVPALRMGSSAVQFSDSEVNRDTSEWITLANIEISTIDEILSSIETRVNAIKIDVEGYEMNVLKGAVLCLTNDKPDILLECLSYQELLEITNYLQEFDYSCWKSLDGEKMTIEFCESVEDRTRARNYVFRSNLKE